MKEANIIILITLCVAVNKGIKKADMIEPTVKPAKLPNSTFAARIEENV